ncbi:MAG: TonB-dependent siderophore receptor [Oceanospirillales bacterium]|nr:TonB-dependent siderophore receptor [Oceanospirillales bacterium]
MKTKPHALSLAIATLIASQNILAASEGDSFELNTLEVNDTAITTPQDTQNIYRSGVSSSATGLKLSQQETPQTVTTVTRAQMDDFGLNGAKDVLNATIGVTVENFETDRSYFTARGYDIQNFQMDGLGLPFTYGLLYGDLDTAMFDRIEVLRGANGLMSGTGTPSATVNYVRKRPTEAFQASADVSYSSWDTKRVSTDISGTINEAGTVRGRFVAASQEGDSYLDRYSNERNLFYGVIEVDLSDSTLLTFGHSYQKSMPNGVLWGALPLYYSDGTPTDYDRSTSTAADWSYWDNTREQTFVELQQQLANGWQAKTTLTRINSKSDSSLFYVYGTPDADTESGLYAYPSNYTLDNEQYMADAYVSGNYTFGGREHEAVIGASWSRSELSDMNDYGSGIGDPIGDLNLWTGSWPAFTYSGASTGSEWTDKTASLYGATRLSLTDRLAVITGARYTRLRSNGYSYGKNKARRANDLTPYAGVVYDLTDRHAVYASYTEIFKPQNETDLSGNRLEPVTGDSYEVGLKSLFLDDKLQTGIALFSASQSNLAETGGYRGDGSTYYVGEDTESQGIELTLAGELAPGLQASAGYTYIDIEDEDGKGARSFIPKQQVKVATTYQAMPKLKVGASLSWQDEISRVQNAAAGIVTRQDDYALIDLMGEYEINDNLSARVNVYNLTDEKYLTSLYTSQGYYGAPRSAMLTLSWNY